MGEHMGRHPSWSPSYPSTPPRWPVSARLRGVTKSARSARLVPAAVRNAKRPDKQSADVRNAKIPLTPATVAAHTCPGRGWEWR
jgi:hypothetical protein